MVLNSGNDNMPAFVLTSARNPQKGVIVSFGRPGIEDDLLRPGADGTRDALPRVFQGFKRFATKSVRTGWVPEAGIKIRPHGLNDARIRGGCGGVIEINAVHKLVHRV